MNPSQNNIYELILKQKNEQFNIHDNLVMLTFDDNYIDQTINLMLSIIKYQTNPVSFCCVCLNLENENIQRLLDLGFGIQISIYKFHYDEVDTGHWPKTTLLRVFSPWLLDTQVEKILYLDSDMLCVGDLKDLFRLDTPWIAMGNEISGNVSGIRRSKRIFAEDYPTQLYCNAGTVVMNLANIRSNYEFSDVFCACCEICESYYCNDQDFLNIFFMDKITYFNGLRYNFQAYELKGSAFYKYALENSRIIHFSSEKPWKDTADREIMRVYMDYSEYPPMRKRVKRAWQKSLYKAPYRAFYRLLAKIKQKILTH